MLAAGTLALLAERGHEVTIATMTSGDCGSDVLPAAEIADLRHGEATAAAAVIGAEYRCLQFPDLGVFNDNASRRRVTALLRQVRPQIVLAASPIDYHCDHEAASVLVRDACFAAPVPNYSTAAIHAAPPLDAIPHLYYVDAVEGSDSTGNLIVPHFVVDVCSTLETKKRMLACHASQREWLLRHHGMDDYIESMVNWTHACGARAGIAYGEGFRLHRGHPYPRSPLLEELLGAELVHRPRL